MAQAGHSGSRPESNPITTETLGTLATLKGGTTKTGITLDHQGQNTKQTQFRTTSLQSMGYGLFPGRRGGPLSVVNSFVGNFWFLHCQSITHLLMFL